MPSPNPATRRQHSGNAVQTTIVGSINAAATTFDIVDATGWPDGSVGPFVVTMNAGTISEEKINCSTRAGNTVNVATSGRGFDGTTATTHTGATVYPSISAVELDELNAHAAASTGVHGAAGAVVGTTDTQTLTNKTMSGASNTFSAIPKASITGAPSGNFVGTNDTQTLTNKTMSGASNTFSNIPQSAVAGGVGAFKRDEYLSAGTQAYADPGSVYQNFRFTVVGSGGGGAGGESNGSSGLPTGGGGGATRYVTVARASLTFPLELVVPAGGGGGAAVTNGTAGSAATVKNSSGAGSTIASASGGSGGVYGTGTVAGGAGATTGTGTGVHVSGQNGEDSDVSAGITRPRSGGSAVNPFGARRPAGTSGTAGTAGTHGSGGGAGANNSSGAAGVGGAGGDGIVIVEAWS